MELDSTPPLHGKFHKKISICFSEYLPKDDQTIYEPLIGISVSEALEEVDKEDNSEGTMKPLKFDIYNNSKIPPEMEVANTSQEAK